MFELHPQLRADCHMLGFINDHHLLLHKNALVPWFILVPETDCNEIYKLPTGQQQSVYQSIHLLAQFVEQTLSCEKLNIASIGNIVPQLHIHIIGRNSDDFCWPAPVWGQTENKPYSDEHLDKIKQQLAQHSII